MRQLPRSIGEFLSGQHIAVTGVSRGGKLPGNAIYRRLVDSGFQVTPVNPASAEVEGVQSYPDLLSIPDDVHGVVVASPPAASSQLVKECQERGIPRVWLHRSFGAGSVSGAAIKECERAGIDCIVGGCPLMFCEPVDVAHRFMRWWLQRVGRVPR